MAHEVTQKEYLKLIDDGWREFGKVRAKGKTHYNLVHRVNKRKRIQSVLIKEEQND